MADNNHDRTAVIDVTSIASAPSRPRLLVVDDEPINIRVLHHLFIDDYDIFMATDGKQALSVCINELPDLVLLDIEMPGLNGFEVCEQLKADKLTQGIPVIFVTSHASDLVESRGLDAGAVDFIAKPFNPKIVRARVKTHLTLKSQTDLLRNWVYIDALTGLHNRRYFDEHLTIEWGRALRDGTELSLLILDVDFFKQYNDSCGHQAGDECLKKISACIKSSTKRFGDLSARYGGEEFICLLPRSDLGSAIQFAEILRQLIIDLHIVHPASSVSSVVTISIGVCSKPIGIFDNVAELVQSADEQLYLAKQSGRNKTSGTVIIKK